MNRFEVTIHASSLDMLHKLEEANLDINRPTAEQHSETDYTVRALVTEEQLNELKQRGYTVTDQSDVSRIPFERIQELTGMGDRIDGIKANEVEWTADTVRDGYLTVAEIEQELRQTARLFPNWVKLIELPFGTREGRSCLAAKLSVNSRNSSGERIGILLTGNVHAREWGGSDITLNVLKQLVQAYDSRQAIAYGGKNFAFEQIRRILENIDLYVFPEVNPDGKIYSQSFAEENERGFDSNSGEKFWWRKNRYRNQQGTVVGVDVNRNFDFLWESGIGASTDEKSLVYRGPSPASEPETQNIIHLLDTDTNIRFYLDIHSYGELILYNWGDDENQSLDKDKNFQNKRFNGMRGLFGSIPERNLYEEYISPDDERLEISLANRMNQALQAVRGKSYKVKPGSGLYYTSGTTTDYAYSRHLVDPSKPKIYGFTFEFGRQFVPPYEEMKLIIADVSAAITEFCYAVTELKVREPVRS
ncbi:carboxypeptidase [Paenibacillus oralis]|uniref:Carboxypeptidase n=1 Tax=Paenibacillus oralis TaxID=2490856 RepID=A0A3P3U4D8_9BACL|nr:M14 family zinc carboxypeptidase [Paenibacillus oralis]RRJ64656.1 carboxypeptidase [Paenibacillus oralis]